MCHTMRAIHFNGTPHMPAKSRPSFTPLLPDRAFVVQLRQSPDLSPETLAGRAEHISSGRSILFDSLAELYEFMGSAAEPDPLVKPRPAG